MWEVPNRKVMDTSSSSSSVPIMSSRDISHQEGLIGGERSGLATIAISGGGQDKITASGASLCCDRPMTACGAS